MTKELQATLKKLLQEFEYDIKDAEEFTATHVHQFIELAVLKFGATQKSAAEGLAYASAWPKALLDKLKDIEAGVVSDVKAETKVIEAEVNSLIKPKPASAPITPTTTQVQQPAVKKDMSFDITK